MSVMRALAKPNHHPGIAEAFIAAHAMSVLVCHLGGAALTIGEQIPNLPLAEFVALATEGEPHERPSATIARGSRRSVDGVSSGPARTSGNVSTMSKGSAAIGRKPCVSLRRAAPAASASPAASSASSPIKARSLRLGEGVRAPRAGVWVGRPARLRQPRRRVRGRGRHDTGPRARQNLPALVRARHPSDSVREPAAPRRDAAPHGREVGRRRGVDLREHEARLRVARPSQLGARSRVGDRAWRRRAGAGSGGRASAGPSVRQQPHVRRDGLREIVPGAVRKEDPVAGRAGDVRDDLDEERTA